MNAMPFDPIEHAERRFRKEFVRAATDAQRARMGDLFARGLEVYAGHGNGAAIVRQFRGYVESRDPGRIGKALYEFSHVDSGGFSDIACFNLQGYRHSYPHPLLYIDGVVLADWERWPESYRQDPVGFHCTTVYRDGMTSGEIVHAIVKLAQERREQLVADFAAKERTAELAAAEALALRHGMRLVPCKERV